MHRTRHVLALVVLLGMLSALVGCGGTSAPSGGTSGGNTITLQNISFNPSSLTVKVGATVTVKNEDSVPHHIVIGTDDLGVQQPGTTRTWKAPKDAVYNMRCKIHPSMAGQITVGAGGSTIGQPGGGGGGGTPGY